jgi:hypothetical protein
MMASSLPSERCNVKTRADYSGPMRRMLTLVIRTALLATIVAVVRAVRADRTPQRALHGTQPVVGSLDTWPTVPRRPTG